MAQICYYFEAAAQMSKQERENLVVSVPSGNFGNLTAGLLAKALGLPIKRFIAATNANDTVPRYLETGKWECPLVKQRERHQRFLRQVGVRHEYSLRHRYSLEA